MKSKLFYAIGLMSGTSIDGIDASLVETDGYGHVRPLGFVPYAYDHAFRSRLRQIFGAKESAGQVEITAIEKELTELHAEIVSQLLQEIKFEANKVDVIGFHGQTIWHNPDMGITCQIGDGALLAKITNIPVVNDFRSADMEAGGQGAPLVPLYHRALAAKLRKPVAILNVGGVSNITWIGGLRDEDILALDVGPGNAPLDDWMLHHTGRAFDESGEMAASGKVHFDLVDKLMEHPFFTKKPPKSLDRGTLRDLVPDNLSTQDGAATITEMIAYGVKNSLKFMPQKPKHIFVTGGGRLNTTLMRSLKYALDIPVKSVDELGWNGDALEAEAFAYLAVRSRLGLPLSVPNTTGVREPMSGGKYYQP